jgi:hypothetical protein
LTPTIPVERIVQLLIDAGYRRLTTPLDIAGVKFDIPAALVGTGIVPDLIIVADSAFDSDERIKSKLEGIARALDVVRSKRPLTAILAGPRPRKSVLDAISKVCRVLPIGSMVQGDEETALKNWLAVLMPLHLPHTVDAIADPMNELSRRVDVSDPIIGQLLKAAPRGIQDVEKTLYKLVGEALRGAELDTDL